MILAVVVASFLVAMRWPAYAIVGVFALVPPWFALPIGSYAIYPGVAACAGAAVSGALGRKPRVALRPILLLVGSGFLLLVVLDYCYFGLAFNLASPMASWALPFAAGALVAWQRGTDGVARALCIFAPLVGALAILETLMGFRYAEVFPILDTGAADLANFQLRGGHIRAEAAWGHGIALSGFLAAGVTALLTKLSPLRVGLACLCAAGVIATSSRSGYVMLALSAALLVFSHTRRGGAQRTVAVTVLAALGTVVYLLSDHATLDTADYQASSTYRMEVVNLAMHLSSLVGPAAQLGFTDTGLSIAGYQYIDSTLLQVLITGGYVLALALASLYVAILLTSIRNLGSVIATAAAVQVPGLIVAGFLGQHQMFFWFLVGGTCVLCGRPSESDRKSRVTNEMVGALT